MLAKRQPYDQAAASLTAIQLSLEDTLSIPNTDESLDVPTVEAVTSSQEQLARLGQTDAERGTILYLAYGSNLSTETFRKSRGIQPLSQTNVQVPTLRLTFDLPGIPYSEPCFANSGKRDPDQDRPSKEKDGLRDREYNKNKWHKGLIGVVYEVTPKDYAHIIATEGGGAGYQDILVDCFPFKSSDPTRAVPQDPDTKPFQAHTLFAPSLPDGKRPPGGGRAARPDQSYAQPSARYLKLITDGASELSLPSEYQDYLHNIRPYRITTLRQRLGQMFLTALWFPIIMFVFALGRIFANKEGRSPPWLRKLSAAVFSTVWVSYDGFFRPTFGDGERSLPDGGKAVLLASLPQYTRHDHARKGLAS